MSLFSLLMYIHLGLVILRITSYGMRNKDFKGVLSLQIISFPKVTFFYWLGIFWWSSIGLLYCISANNLTLCPWKYMRHVLMNKSINEQCWSFLLEPFPTVWVQRVCKCHTLISFKLDQLLNRRSMKWVRNPKNPGNRGRDMSVCT